MKLTRFILFAVIIISISYTAVSFIPDNTDMDVYFCPKDHCSDKAIKVLESADESIYFMLYSFTDKDIADTLIIKSNDLEVKGIMEKQRITSGYNLYNYLKENNINVIPDKNRATMHNKVFIIDKKIVITGSYNPTKNGNEKNNENMVIIYDSHIANLFLKEFYTLYQT